MAFIYFYLLILFINPYLGMWWKLFPKANRPSWEALVPGYNYYILFKITLSKGFWSLLLIFPGVHLVMMMVANVTILRRFGFYSFWDTVQAIFFPYYLFFRVSKEPLAFGKETNWSNSKEIEDRKWGDHLVLFMAIPVIGHIITTILDAVSRDRPGQKSRVKEWGDSILFALIAAGLIRTYVFEPFQIPTGSMEKTLLVGDFLFVNKLAYGPKVPVTPLSHPLVHNNVPFINIPSYTSLEKGSYFRLPGFGEVQRNDVVVFNYPSGDTAVYDPRMPNGLMGHDYHGIVINEAKRLFIDNFSHELNRHVNSLRSSNPGYQEAFYTFEAKDLILQEHAQEFVDQYEVWTKRARQSLSEEKVAWDMSENRLIEHNGLIYRPVDKRENYIKRCVALPKDWIEIKNAVLYVNDEPAQIFDFQAFKYKINVSGNTVYPSIQELTQNYGLENDEMGRTRMDAELTKREISDSSGNRIIIDELILNITDPEKERILTDYPELKTKIKRVIEAKNDPHQLEPYSKIQNLNYFPKDFNKCNTTTNFERIQIPYEGQVVQLNPNSIPYYRRIITAYEGHTLEEKKDGYYIDGQKSESYTVEMNYYWMMGDNRYNSADSRIWGFVPEDHIVGRALLVWFSKSPYKGIRWERIFKLIE